MERKMLQQGKKRRLAEEQRLAAIAAEKRAAYMGGNQEVQGGRVCKKLAFNQQASYEKRKALPAPPQAKKAKTNSGQRRTAGVEKDPANVPEELDDGFVGDIEGNIYDDERDPEFFPEDEERSGDEGDADTDDEELRQYTEAEKPGFNRHAPRVPPPASNGDSVMGSNAQAGNALVVRQSKWWRLRSDCCL